ncbi:MAG: hypothetical protein HKN45_07215 [Flavobacteriales bacterium]|nr:hypothetical protein [Flavobacteriales bacterium]
MYKAFLTALITILLSYICATGQDGFTQFFYEDGTVSSEGFLTQGKPDGYWKTYYPDGKIKSEGNRRDFLLDSVWSFYSEIDQLTEKIEYDKGLKNGFYDKYSDGELSSRCRFEKDTLNGRCEYYLGGLVQKEVPFVSGLEQGRGYEFNKRAEITAVLTYKDGFLRLRESLNRVDELGRKQGLWKSFYSSRTVHTEATYVDDLKHGLFRTYSETGELLSMLKYVNGELDEGAAETIVVDIRNEYFADGTVRASGSYKEGKKHGIHREYDTEGNIIKSWVYSDGVEVGSGIIGKSGSFEGPWQEYYEDGSLRVEGTYEEGLRAKKWKYYSDSGELIQEGGYRKGKPHGDWVWYYEDGSTRRRESYRRGREDGSSIEYDNTGKVSAEGEYIDGLKEGNWSYRQGDHVIKGEYSSGERTGKWTGVYDNGKYQFKGEFINGYAKGKHRYYFADGTLMQEGKYSSGLKDGEWRRFDEEGELILRSEFKAGIERRLEGVKITPTYEELGID